MSVCQNLWFRTADFGKKGEAIEGSFFFKFPLHQQSSGPFGRLSSSHLFSECSVCMLSQSRPVVKGPGTDGDRDSVFAAVVSGGKGG